MTIAKFTKSAFAAALALATAGAAHARQQGDLEDAISQPVVQPIPNADTMQLNAALARLGRNPRDIEALIDAGKAALTIGDVDAAVGFFRRAGQLAPADGRVKAGLAGALVRSGDPFAAIPLFQAAEAAGAGGADMNSDRGLAYDLVGDNIRAQAYYRQAIGLASSDETLRRLAISLAMIGDRRAADGALSPLLARQDKAAQRTRAFVYAILGQQEEAVAIASTSMPTELAASMAPYLRYMRTLTRPQQAAAANLGVFPRASEIGRDDPRMAAFAPPKPPVLAVASSTAAEPGRNSRARRGSQPTRIARAEPPREPQSGKRIAEAQAALPVVAQAPPAPVAPPEPVVAREVELPPIDQPRPQPEPALPEPVRPEPVRIAQAEPVLPPAAAPAPAPVVAEAAPLPRVVAAATVPAVAAPPLAPSAPAFVPLGSGDADKAIASFDLARTAPAPPPAVTPAPQAPPPARAPSLAEAFSDFAAPARDIAPAPGAVDLRRIQPVRDGAAAATPATGRNARTPAPPSHPSRIWVQVATGRDKAALGFDWRRLARQEATVIKDRKGYVSAWGQTNRLLTGPFESEAAANAFITQLRRADVPGAFVWNSPAGQVVDALAGK